MSTGPFSSSQTVTVITRPGNQIPMSQSDGGVAGEDHHFGLWNSLIYCFMAQKFMCNMSKPWNLVVAWRLQLLSIAINCSSALESLEPPGIE